MSRYELLERIGVGGMAEIFRGVATAEGGFQKLVAIKKILPHLGRDQRFVQMLIAEAKTLAALRQRNIVQIYDVGIGEDGEYFLVMEFVDGCDLGALYAAMEKARAEFPRDLALHIGSEVCEALEHAHRMTDASGNAIGLVHRDVSPSNVLLSHAGEVKLTDFGIAKRIEEGSIVQSIKGKFAYMSPEQARAERLDPRSDIFSLGVILYELTVGRRLYSHLPDFEALRQVREARVPRPRDVDPTFPQALETILLRALAPEPAMRYRSAAEFGAALRDFRYSASTTAGDPAKELRALLARFGRGAGDGARSPARQKTVVRIQTVAGFPATDVAVERHGPLGTDAHRIFDSFAEAGSSEDAATRLIQTRRSPSTPPTGNGERSAGAATFGRADGGAAMLGGAGQTGPVFGGAGGGAGPTAGGGGGPMFGGAAAAPSPPARERAATPTVKDVFPAGALLADDAEFADTAPLQAVPTELLHSEEILGRRRFRALVLALVVLVLAAFVAFLLAGTLFPLDEPGPPPGPSSGTGDSLPGPSMKAPIQRGR